MIRAVLIFSFLCSSAIAQTIYRPVQFEYGQGDSKFYYGGIDSAVIARTMHSLSASAHSGRRQIVTVSDALPYQPNASVYGYTANDAKNDAYRAQPRYFTMRPAAMPEARTDNHPGASTIEIKPYVRPTTRLAR